MVFLRHLYIKNEHLPRQARDKHRENSKKGPFFLRCVCRVWSFMFKHPPLRSPVSPSDLVFSLRADLSTCLLVYLPAICCCCCVFLLAGWLQLASHQRGRQGFSAAWRRTTTAGMAMIPPTAILMASGRAPASLWWQSGWRCQSVRRQAGVSKTRLFAPLCTKNAII
jgi:hypothetical protein